MDVGISHQESALPGASPDTTNAAVAGPPPTAAARRNLRNTMQQHR